uniref:HMG box domain-containing protein n=1 Tax=Entomoneis paludosa TaxID=265537 RepID=A0A7S2VBD4_9STRA|mmetsp:Transcript_13181/g.27352  ORF Transcript_13181/g.27352 Transcript_13181/m.27352 type:complete len:561 (+) Transcript_13181:66-1748(+)
MTILQATAINSLSITRDQRKTKAKIGGRELTAMSDRSMGARGNNSRFGAASDLEGRRGAIGESKVGAEPASASTSANDETSTSASESKQQSPKPGPAQRSTNPSRKGGRSKKPEGMPSRPLSAYNLFFREQREIIVEERTVALGETTARGKRKRAKISFEELAKLIGGRWKNIAPDELERFKAMAEEDAKRYKSEMEVYSRTAKPDVQERASPPVAAAAAAAAAAASQSSTPSPPRSPSMNAAFDNFAQFQSGTGDVGATVPDRVHPDPMLSRVLGGMHDFLGHDTGSASSSSQPRMYIPDQVQLVHFDQQQPHHYPSHPQQQQTINNNLSSMQHHAYGSHFAPSGVVDHGAHHPANDQHAYSSAVYGDSQPPSQYQRSNFLPQSNQGQQGYPTMPHQRQEHQPPYAPQPYPQQQMVGQYNQLPSSHPYATDMNQYQAPNTNAFQATETFGGITSQQSHQQHSLDHQGVPRSHTYIAPAPAHMDSSLLHLLGGSDGSGASSAPNPGGDTSWMDPRPIAPAADKPPSPLLQAFAEQHEHKSAASSGSSNGSRNDDHPAYGL